MRDHLFWRTTSFWQKVLHSSVYEPVTKDHLSWETIFLWSMGWSFKTGSIVPTFPRLILTPRDTQRVVPKMFHYFYSEHVGHVSMSLGLTFMYCEDFPTFITGSMHFPRASDWWYLPSNDMPQSYLASFRNSSIKSFQNMTTCICTDTWTLWWQQWCQVESPGESWLPVVLVGNTKTCSMECGGEDLASKECPLVALLADPELVLRFSRLPGSRSGTKRRAVCHTESRGPSNIFFLSICITCEQIGTNDPSNYSTDLYMSVWKWLSLNTEATVLILIEAWYLIQECPSFWR